MHKLLGLDPRIERPNAYQIFGLEVLEDDDAKLRSAIRDTIARLKEAKPTADPAAWAQAAKSVSKAQQILSDSTQKANYDQRLRNTFESVAVTRSKATGVAVAAPASAATATVPAFDPLQGWLPEGDPFAAFDMAVALESLSDEPIDEEDDDEAMLDDTDESFEQPQASPAVSMRSQVPEPAVAGPGVGLAPALPSVGGGSPRSRKRRKRGFPVAGALMTLFVLGLFGGIGYCVKLLVDRENTRTAQVAQTPPKTTTTIVRSDNRPRDNVMGDLLPANPSPQVVEVDGFPMGSSDDAMDDDSMSSNDNMSSDMVSDDSMDSDMASESETPSEPDTSMDRPSEDMIAAADKAAEAARDAIRNHDWSQMMPLSEKAFELAMSPEQKKSASARRRLVHYATEYQAAIDRSLEQLRIDGGTLQLRENLIVNVVEVTPEKLILQVNGRPRDYDRKALPMPVVSALAPKSLPDDEAVLATFRAAWQCVQENAIDADFEDAFSQWKRVEGQSEEANVEGLEAEVKVIFNK
ncbi:MAG: hypothetical protein R3C05_09765 [Pirellulaceae bacterium]